MTQRKPWYRSKTLWFNIGVALVAAGSEMAPLLDVFDAETVAAVRPWLIVFTSVGNMILRTVTETRVTF